MIQEIMILNDKGIPIFHYSPDASPINDYNYPLIASYFDQICKFTKFGFNESLNSLKMDKSIFYFYTHSASKLHLILKCEGTTDESKIKRRTIDDCAVIIFDKFITKFQNELKEFKGNITPFKSFSKDLDTLIYFKKDSDSSLISPEAL
ncbi:MAG: hypothetical protein ACFE9R_14270 [Candidatus Hermodarchaeota archaeon]